jgi:hypothetical protein
MVSWPRCGGFTRPESRTEHPRVNNYSKESATTYSKDFLSARHKKRKKLSFPDLG